MVDRNVARNLTRFTYIRTRAGWLSENLPAEPLLELSEEAVIEARSKAMDQTGPHRIWEGYDAVKEYPGGLIKEHTASQVRTRATEERFFAWLATTRRATTVVEFGSAFGVSGMYWLAGLKPTGGFLYAFEPNAT